MESPGRAGAQWHLEQKAWGQKLGRKLGVSLSSLCGEALCQASHSIWVCYGITASNSTLACFLTWDSKKIPLDSSRTHKQAANGWTITISLQPNSKTALGVKLHPRSFLPSEYTPAVANAAEQRKWQGVWDTGQRESENTNFCLRERSNRKTSICYPSSRKTIY